MVSCILKWLTFSLKRAHQIMFLWVLTYMSIEGNERENEVAKEAVSLSCSRLKSPSDVQKMLRRVCDQS